MKSLWQMYLATTASLLLLTASALYADPLKAVVIGTVDQANRQAWLKQELLHTRFANGTPIDHLLVRQYHDGYHLLRLGKSATGACLSESIPLQLSGNRLHCHRGTLVYGVRFAQLRRFLHTELRPLGLRLPRPRRAAYRFGSAK